MLPDLAVLRDIVATVAREEALTGFADVEREFKWDGSVVTEVDHRIQARMERELNRRWPQYAFLGEEMTAAEQQRMLDTSATGLWCLDPLDGTTNFASGLPFFSVSLALIVGGEAVIGLVYDPVRDECFSAEKGHGAQLNAKRMTRPPQMELRRCIACVDFKRLPGHLAGQLASAFPYMSQRNIGSSCLDWCWLAAGRFQVYIHGGQKFWDYAAGHLILTEAGGAAATLDGEAVYSGSLAPRSVVAAMNPELFDAWQAWVDNHKG